LTTAIGFFIVEMGDRTRIATIPLAARVHQIGLVALGASLGMQAFPNPPDGRLRRWPGGWMTVRIRAAGARAPPSPS
jgi:hypothetical protein